MQIRKYLPLDFDDGDSGVTRDLRLSQHAPLHVMGPKIAIKLIMTIAIGT